MQEAIIVKAKEVCAALMRWSRQDLSRSPIDAPYDGGDFKYAQALLLWEARNEHPEDIFSTDSPMLLEFRRELEAEFGLPVMTHAEAEKRKRERAIPYLTVPTHGIE